MPHGGGEVGAQYVDGFVVAVAVVLTIEAVGLDERKLRLESRGSPGVPRPEARIAARRARARAASGETAGGGATLLPVRATRYG